MTSTHPHFLNLNPVMFRVVVHPEVRRCKVSQFHQSLLGRIPDFFNIGNRLGIQYQVVIRPAALDHSVHIQKFRVDDDAVPIQIRGAVRTRIRKNRVDITRGCC